MAGFADIIRQWALDDGATNPEIRIMDEGNHAQHAFCVVIEGERVQAWFDANERGEWVNVALYVPEVVPAGRRAAVAELATWLNDGVLEIGNLEVSSERGDVRFRASLMAPSEQVAPGMLTRLVDAGGNAMKRLLPAIRAVAFAGMSPLAAARMATWGDGEFSPGEVGADGTAPWSSFPGSERLQAWAAEVRAALDAGADGEAWRMVGHAIVVEHEYSAIGPDLARRLAADCGLPLGVFDGDDLHGLPDAEVFERSAPLMLYFGPGDWQDEKNGDESGDAARKVRGKVLALLRNFNPARPVICVTLADTATQLVSPLRRPGMFDRWFRLPKPAYAAAGELLLDLVGKERCAPSLAGAAAKVGKLLSYRYESPMGRHLVALGLRRLHARLGRPLEFLDLVEIEVHGLSESAEGSGRSEDVRRCVACHEAGHAAMAYLDSAGHDIPEYSSIVSRGHMEGVVVDSLNYAFAHEGRYTFEGFRHEIRTMLAGRAAEELYFGTSGVSIGSQSDLENSTRRASTAFAMWGFAPGMDGAENSSSNLAVILDKPTPSEQAHLERLVRDFLDREYRAVLGMLAEHRPLLDAIADRLQSCAVLNQEELAAICRDHSDHSGGSRQMCVSLRA